MKALLVLKFLSELASKLIKSSILISTSVTAWAAANSSSCGCQELNAKFYAAVDDVCAKTKFLYHSGSEFKHRFE